MTLEDRQAEGLKVTRGRALATGAGALAGAAGLRVPAAFANVARAAGTPIQPGKPRTVVWALAAIADWNLGIDVGFYDACRLLGWKYKKIGVPVSQYSAANHIEAINRAILTHPDVLVTPNWVEGVAHAVEGALKQGIFVVINNANNYPNPISALGLAFIGQNEYNAGYQSGTKLAQVLAAKGKRKGTVIGGNGFPQNANLANRVRGAADAIAAYDKKHGTSFRVQSFLDQSGVNEASSVTAYKAKITQLGGSFIGIFASADISTSPAVKALQDMGAKPGQYPIGAMDVSTASLTSLSEGWVSHVVDQQFHAQGFLPVLLAWEALERGGKVNDYDTSGKLITKNGLATASAMQSKLSSLGKAYGVKLS